MAGNRTALLLLLLLLLQQNLWWQNALLPDEAAKAVPQVNTALPLCSHLPVTPCQP
jgi:hypothetical protein